MKKIITTLTLLAALGALTSCHRKTAPQPPAIPGETLLLADPAVFLDSGTYYIYGTNSPDGFLVYASDDLIHWHVPAEATGGHALRRGESFGDTGFWAPQVFRRNGQYYMVYTANEQIAVATAPHPAGPFRQETLAFIQAPTKQIDPYVFFDDDGTPYLFHVRLSDGNRIFVAEMTGDLREIKEETATQCIVAADGWENTWKEGWTVAEGPTVLKHGSLYYLFYSANDFRSIDYAVGYAVAPSPLGPWEKTPGSPILHRHTTGYNGSGHGDFFLDKNNNLRYVFHIHNSDTTVSPRRTAIISARFVPGETPGADRMQMDFETLFLPLAPE